VALEEIVFLAAAAVRALKATEKKHRHADRDQDGEDISVDSEPMQQAAHG
jgi:hypothetical protein